MQNCFRVLFALLFVALATKMSFAQSATFEPLVGWDDQLFPSYIVSTATMRQETAVVEDVLAEDNDVVDESEENAFDDDSDTDSIDDAVDGQTDDSAELGDDETSGAIDTTCNEGIRLGDTRGLIGIRMLSPKSNCPVVVTAQCDGWIQTSTIRTVLSDEGVMYSIFPKIIYAYDRWASVNQTTPINITFSVSIDDGVAEQLTSTATVRSIHDCPFGIIDGENFIDTSFVFAAYVNEQHPYVDKLLREALDSGIVTSFSGYQSGEEAETIRQVYAIWEALVRRDMRYSSITATAGASEKVFSQHVRMLDESLNNSQANCVDGSVLFVSALRKIDIQADLVFVPGHCFVCFYLDSQRTSKFGFETTLIGESSNEDLKLNDDSLNEIISEEYAEEPSWVSFVAALSVGTSSIEEHVNEFADSENYEYQMIDISAARRIGILPIAFLGKEVYKFINVE